MTTDKLDMKVDFGEWIVVCDGRKALILENTGDKRRPNLKTKEVFEHADLSTRALGADAPGRTHESVGRRMSAVEQTDWHDEAERAFLVSLANRLDTAIATGETARLNIVASPRALGMIRRSYSSAVRKAIKSELGKDLIKLPLDEIEKKLFE